MKPHQERVVVERDELEVKVEKLMAFISPENQIFLSLPSAEQSRLFEQCLAMQLYSSILTRRIEAFEEAK